MQYRLALASLVLAGCLAPGDSDPFGSLDLDACASGAAAVLADADVLDEAADEYDASAKERRVVAAYWLVLIDSDRNAEADPALLTAGFEAFFDRLGGSYQTLGGDVCTSTAGATQEDGLAAQVGCEESCVPASGELLAPLFEDSDVGRAMARRLVDDPRLVEATDELHRRLGDDGLAGWRGVASPLDVLSDLVGQQLADEVLDRVGVALLGSSAEAAPTEAGAVDGVAVVGGLASAITLRATLRDLRTRYNACVADRAKRCAVVE